MIRYDTAHGFLHVHRFWKPHGERIDVLEREASHDYTEALAAAVHDCHRNHRRYRAYIFSGEED